MKKLSLITVITLALMTISCSKNENAAFLKDQKVACSNSFTLSEGTVVSVYRDKISIKITQVFSNSKAFSSAWEILKNHDSLGEKVIFRKSKCSIDTSEAVKSVASSK